jgi:hypothetical protein
MWEFSDKKRPLRRPRRMRRILQQPRLMVALERRRVTGSLQPLAAGLERRVTALLQATQTAILCSGVSQMVRRSFFLFSICPSFQAVPHLSCACRGIISRSESTIMNPIYLSILVLVVFSATEAGFSSFVKCICTPPGLLYREVVGRHAEGKVGPCR